MSAASVPAAPARAVLFDLGGVVIDWNPRHLYRTLFDDERAMERFLADVCTPAWNAELDRGRPFAEAVADLCARHPGEAELVRAYHERWIEMVPGEVPGTRALIARLRERHPVFALTNWSAETFPLAAERHPWLIGDFDDVLVSGREGVIKPDRAIFDLAARRFGLDPATTLFVDDSPTNVEAAARYGWHAHRFVGAATLARALDDHGLL